MAAHSKCQGPVIPGQTKEVPGKNVAARDKRQKALPPEPKGSTAILLALSLHLKAVTPSPADIISRQKAPTTTRFAIVPGLKAHVLILLAYVSKPKAPSVIP
jgi:hypothetical protein